MPEAYSPDICKMSVRGMKPQVMAFDASDFKGDVIACAKDANAEIYVDRLGVADNPEAWQKAIDTGASGIQTNLPAELATYLRAQPGHALSPAEANRSGLSQVDG
jgi:glycerophosphoryl diester phosphodiesterase